MKYLKRIIAGLMLVPLLLLLPTILFASSAGPNSGGTFADDATVGTLVWSTPSNAAASDDVRTGFNGNLNDISHYLKATNFGFSIPSGATIDGITVEIERRGSGVGVGGIDSSIKIVKGGSISGDEKAAAGAWPSSDGLKSYGGAADLWGLAWTDADINASTFGVVVSGKITVGTGPGSDMLVDHIRITVTYTGGAAAPVSQTKEISIF